MPYFLCTDCGHEFESVEKVNCDWCGSTHIDILEEETPLENLIKHKDDFITRLKAEGARKIHLYDYKNILRPRGSMNKESLSALIFEHLMSSFETWTNPEYGNSLTKSEAMNIIKENLEQEVEIAWKTFLKHSNV